MSWTIQIDDGSSIPCQKIKVVPPSDTTFGHVSVVIYKENEPDYERLDHNRIVVRGPRTEFKFMDAILTYYNGMSVDHVEISWAYRGSAPEILTLLEFPTEQRLDWVKLGF